MRKQLKQTVENILEKNNKTVLLLGDIGVYAFRDSFSKYPERCMNMGACEQVITNIMSGLSLSGLIGIMHTIVPFMTQRNFEQLKLHAYQGLNGNFISVGSSYDYASLGETHYGASDVGILKQIPNFEIVVPGTSKEFDVLFNESYDNNKSTYYRLSEYENSVDIDVNFGKANVIKKGNKGTIIVVGNLLNQVLEASKYYDVTILYYTTIEPFDSITLRTNYTNQRILVVEPNYKGALAYDILKELGQPLDYIEFIGVKHKFSSHYGTKQEHDIENEITIEDIKIAIRDMINWR